MSGPQRAVLGAHVHLLGEVAVLDHAGELGEPAQRELAPLTAHFGPAQRIHQLRVSFCSACCPTITDSIEALQAAEGFGALLLDALHLLLGLAQRFANRRDQRLDRLLALHQAAAAF